MIVRYRTPSQIVLEDPGLLEWRDGLSCLEPGHKYTQAFRKGRWDGKWYPGTRFERTGGLRLVCGRGLLSRVLEDFPDAQVGELPTVGPALDFAGLPIAQLRNYQKAALSSILAAKWCRIAFATNAGKGAIIALFSAAAAAAGRTVLITCAQVSVYDALEQEIAKWSKVKVGKVVAGVKDPPGAAVVLAMVPTLQRRLDSEKWKAWCASFDTLLVDEADEVLSDSWEKVFKACKGTEYRAGFSGSFPDPTESDDTYIRDLKLEERLGPITLRVSNADLVDRAISARPVVQLFPYYHPFRIVSTKRQDYPLPPGVELDAWFQMEAFERRDVVLRWAVIENQARAEFVRELVHPEMPTVVIVDRIEHGELLDRVIPGSFFLHGGYDQAARSTVLTRFKDPDDTEVRTLIVTNILDRGTNELGTAVGIVFASGQGSTAQVLQRIGRGLRRAGGKEFVFLRDVLDGGHDYLAKQSRKRIRIYNEQDFDVEIYRHGRTQIETANASGEKMDLASADIGEG